MALAMALVAPLPGAVLILLILPLLCYRLVAREERFLEATQGELFRAYLRAVPRFLPSLHAGVPGDGRRPDWINGLSSEVFFWSFALGYAGFAATLNILWLWLGLLASPLLSWLAGRFLQRPAPPSREAASGE